MNSYTWTLQCQLTSKNLHSSALCKCLLEDLSRAMTDRDWCCLLDNSSPLLHIQLISCWLTDIKHRRNILSQLFSTWISQSAKFCSDATKVMLTCRLYLLISSFRVVSLLHTSISLVALVIWTLHMNGWLIHTTGAVRTS